MATAVFRTRRFRRTRETVAGVAMNPQDADGVADVLLRENGVIEPATEEPQGTTDAPQPGMIRQYDRHGRPTRAVINPQAHPKPMVYSRRRAGLARSVPAADGRLADRVYRALARDYPPEVLNWVSNVRWVYRPAVPLSRIRMARRPGGRHPAKVRGIAQAIRARQKLDPIVLVATPTGLQIADGYHRTLAAQHAGRKTIPAYVALDAPAHGPWETAMHAAKMKKSRALAKAIQAQGADEGRWVTMHGAHVWIDAHGQPQWPGTHTRPYRAYRHGDPLPPHMGTLKIPPAWRDVRVNEDPDAALWVTGIDQAGRRQTVYAPAFLATNAAAKFQRVQALDAERAALTRQMAAAQRHRDPALREASACLALIAATGIRPGSDRETHAAVKAYGATTLEGRHVTQEADGTVVLRYVGKKGVALAIPVPDRALARRLLQRAQDAGPAGRLFATSDTALRRFSHTLDHGRFTPKDFRTDTGTRLALDCIGRQAPPTDAKSYAQAVRRVAQAVAKALGNTPTVALNSYIAPQVFAAWRSTAGV